MIKKERFKKNYRHFQKIIEYYIISQIFIVKNLNSKENISFNFLNFMYNIRCVEIYYLSLNGIYNNPTLFILQYFFIKLETFRQKFGTIKL